MQGAWAIESSVQLSSSHFEVNVVYIELKRALPVVRQRRNCPEQLNECQHTVRHTCQELYTLPEVTWSCIGINLVIRQPPQDI